MKPDDSSALVDVKWRLLVAISPVWVWTLAITALPHKEERFLYVVYPLVRLCSPLCHKRAM